MSKHIRICSHTLKGKDGHIHRCKHDMDLIPLDYVQHECVCGETWYPKTNTNIFRRILDWFTDR